MFELLETYQLDIMLAMSAICFMVGVFAAITRSIPRQRKLALVNIEFSGSVLLFSDRLAYMYHGIPGDTAYWMVRISNFLVFFMTISIVHAFNLYLADLCRNEVGVKKKPIRIKIVEFISLFGWIMVIISQFTGLYYTFDESNAYVRGPGFLICYVIPFIALFIQLSLVFQFFKKLSLRISVPILLFSVLPMIASIFQALFYGVSLTNMTIVGMGVVLYIFALTDMNERFINLQKKQLDEAQDLTNSVLVSYEQTITAVARAIDSKDRYTRGHTLRTAEYAKDIAVAMGKDLKDSYEVYFSAMMTNIGKIKIPDAILTKRDRLTSAEEALMKTLPKINEEILSEIREISFINTAARFFRERYDGRGYPEGLKGDAIPLTARIVAVADAYDEMTSFKPERGPLAQGKVRELLLSGSGKEFDPDIVKIMVDMIDRDVEYNMREEDDASLDEDERNDFSVISRMHFEEYKKIVSDGVILSGNHDRISFEVLPDPGHDRETSLPALILFDSFDRCVHRNEKTIRNQHYIEFGEIWLDGHTICTSARDIQTEIIEKEGAGKPAEKEWVAYEIDALCIDDHVKISIDSAYIHADVIVALPDATRFVFVAATGEYCSIRKISMKKLGLSPEDRIERIAPKVSFFNRRDGDVANVEVDGCRGAYSESFLAEDGLQLSFTTRSLPGASLVQNCAYILIYSSADGKVNGEDYEEYACIRLDGEDVTENGKAKNSLDVRRDENFAGWDEWKEEVRQGLDCTVEFKRSKNRITFVTDNAGICIDCTTMLPDTANDVRVALTGHLCTLMSIKVR